MTLNYADVCDGRAWIVEIVFPGKKAVWCGNVFAPREAKEMEVERIAAAKASEHLPDGFKIIKLIPGQIVWLPEREERKAA